MFRKAYNLITILVVTISSLCLFTTSVYSDPLIGSLRIPLYFQKGDQQRIDKALFSRCKRELFGKNIDDWLKVHEQSGNKAELEKAVDAMLQDEDFRRLFENPPEDIRIEIIKLAVRKKIYLGTSSFYIFLKHLRSKVEDQMIKRRIKTVSAFSIESYVSFMTSIRYPLVQQYLDSDEFRGLPREDRLGELVGYIQKLGLPLGNENLGSIHIALPNKLSSNIVKKDIQDVEVPLRVYNQVRTAIADERIQAYLDSEGFKDIPKEDKLGELVGYIQKLGLPLESDNLGSIHSALPAKLSSNVVKKNIQRVNLPLRTYNQVRTAVADERVQAYLDSEEFRVLPREDRLGELVGYIQKLGLPLESESFNHLHSALPYELSSNIAKRDIQKVNLPLRTYNQVRTAVADERVQAYLDSEEFRGLPKEDKLGELVAYMQGLRLALENENLGNIHTALPNKLSSNIVKKDIQSVEVPLMAYNQVRRAIADEKVQKYLDSDGFKDIPREDKLGEIVAYIQKLSLPFESDNLGSIHTALPYRLSSNILKKDIQRVNLSLRTYNQVRTAVADERVQAYLDSEEFRGLPKEDKLGELVAYIQVLRLPLESENLEHIHTALPYRLSSNIAKRDIQKIRLPLRTYNQVRTVVADERVQAYLDSEEFRGLPKEDKLGELIAYIEGLRLPVESDNLGSIHTALPHRLSSNILKKDIQRVYLPTRVYDQVRTAIADEKVQKYLDSDGFKDIPREDKLGELVGYIQRLGLPLESDNLEHIHSALPTKLSANVSKSHIRSVRSGL